MAGKTCPDCRVVMTAGRRRDKGDGFAVSQEAWLSGAPARETLGWFSGQGDGHPVTTYACPQCGLLLSYVDPSAAR